MNAPSNANTSGLEVVAWTSEEYLADTRLRKHGAYWMWGNPASSASVALVTAASVQALEAELIETRKLVVHYASRATAAEARADRLAKALERIETEYLLNHTSKWARETARAALQQETQP